MGWPVPPAVLPGQQERAGRGGAGGEDVSSLFYDTVAEKLATSPDSTVQQGEGN